MLSKSERILASGLKTANVFVRTFAQKINPNEPKPIYLDVQATSPMVFYFSFAILERIFKNQDPRVVDAMLPYMIDDYGNPHSRTHAYGWKAEEAVERAREQVANLIKVKINSISFQNFLIS